MTLERDLPYSSASECGGSSGGSPVLSKIVVYKVRGNGRATSSGKSSKDMFDS